MLVSANALQLPLPDNSVQCIVTSPPYWGLRAYAGKQDLEWADGWRGGYGLEPTIALYIEHTVQILEELKRVLRKDGVLFWNIGDSYYGSGTLGSGGSYGSPKQASVRGSYFATDQKRHAGELARKNLCLVPERTAIAAQDAGWYVRSVIIWDKPNAMCESVSDRPTDSYEQILMLTKSESYYWDAAASREPATPASEARYRYAFNGPNAAKHEQMPSGADTTFTPGMREPSTTRNIRNVWRFATQGYHGAHFATFPEELPRRCIEAATSDHGACASCGTPWVRWTEKELMPTAKASKKGKNEKRAAASDGNDQGSNRDRDGHLRGYSNRFKTLGWKPGCECFDGTERAVRPCLVLDPFGGSGTTGRVAIALRRRAVVSDLAYGRVTAEDVEKGRAYHELADKRTRNVQVNLL